ncbi:hypothetical protein PPYR_00822 [Photinus pyralis]|uniref:Adenine phosphoribosyltransferase n=1 Tax=Photinus pyralis TaxID=7054 RepID=A0A5N4B2M3_PHOPY|nr:adenine phosphoribosyltransferase [Photinus pyralis]KAB0803852.1 hypothetical protein PPYR_00822 [Photinus pyralis]
MSRSSKLEVIKNTIKSYPDFPKPGVLFRDIFAVLNEPDVASLLYEVLCDEARSITPPVDCVAGLDARGFLFGTIVAKELNIPFVPIRKKGKLPGSTQSVRYKLEYGEDEVEIQRGNISTGQTVLVIDDLLATGGTLTAAVELIKKCGADAVCLIVIELTDLQGRKSINAPIHSLVQY